ncbi:MAG: FecR domain-containing protein [Gemmatimonadaceae bacterium]
MSSNPINWDAVARYLARESPAEEETAVREWLESHPKDAKVVAALDVALGKLTLGPDAGQGIDVEAALTVVKQRRDAGLQVIRGSSTRTFRAKRPETRWVLIAAAAGFVLAIGTGVWRDRTTPLETAASAIAVRTLTTAVGGRDSLVLPDGSRVILGPGSELTIAERFGQSERRVSLRGEALFTVVHDERKPFIVTANDTDIRDIGTAFAVHTDAGGVRIAVTEGIVEVKHTTTTGASTTLNAGDIGTVSRSGAVSAERGVSTADDLAWTRGRLVFRDTPLVEVGEDLRRWYGVYLDIRDPALERRPLSASFQGDSIKHVLDVIGRTLGATLERRGDTVIVRSVPR